MHAARVLILGYGNPGRGDDGLGPACAAALAKLDLAHVTVDSDYQLTVEDAAAVAQHDVVVFVDAAAAGPEPYSFGRIEPGTAVTFSSHSVSPESVLALAEQCFGARPAGYVLGIRGYAFDEFVPTLDEESGAHLSAPAQANLAAALQFVVGFVNDAGRTPLPAGARRMADPAEELAAAAAPSKGDR